VHSVGEWSCRFPTTTRWQHHANCLVRVKQPLPRCPPPPQTHMPAGLFTHCCLWLLCSLRGNAYCNALLQFLTFHYLLTSAGGRHALAQKSLPAGRPPRGPWTDHSCREQVVNREVGGGLVIHSSLIESKGKTHWRIVHSTDTNTSVALPKSGPSLYYHTRARKGGKQS
jgi:hypothetical protein